MKTALAIKEKLEGLVGVISLRITLKDATIEMIEKLQKKAKIELEYATTSSPYLKKLLSFLQKINDSKTYSIIKKYQKIIKKNNSAVLEKELLKSLRESFIVNQTNRVDMLFRLEALLNDLGSNVECSEYILHVLSNIKSCVLAEYELDKLYKQYLIDNYDAKFSEDEVQDERWCKC